MKRESVLGVRSVLSRAWTIGTKDTRPTPTYCSRRVIRSILDSAKFAIAEIHEQPVVRAFVYIFRHLDDQRRCGIVNAEYFVVT